MAHAHARRPGDGDDRVHRRVGPDAGLRPDGRAQLRPQPVHRPRRLRRDQRLRGALRRGVVDERRHEPRPDRRRDARGDDALGDDRPGLRARDRSAGLRPPPQADPGDDRRRDRRRGADQGRLGTGADRAAAARGVARLDPDRRGDGRQAAPGLGRGRARRASAAALDAQPHQDRPPDPRRRAGPRDGREPRLPHPAPLRRRLRRRLGTRRARRVPVGDEPADRHAADRRPGQRSALHRHHHRRARLDARLPGRRSPSALPAPSRSRWSSRS